MKVKTTGVQLRLIFWGLLLSLLAGCQAAASSAIAPSPTPETPPVMPTPPPTLPPPAPAMTEDNQSVGGAEFEGVIFSQENAAASKAVYSAETYWTPTQADIMALEAKLGPYLEQAAPQNYPGP